MKNNSLKFKIIFSSTFIILAILIVSFDWFRERIDNKVITLIIISFIPWIIKYIKSLEAFGVKAELFSEEQKKKVEINIEKIDNSTYNDGKQNNIDNEINFEKDVITFDNYKYTKNNKNAIVLLESMIDVDETDDILTKIVLFRYQMEKIIKLMCDENDIEYINIRKSSKALYNKNIIKNYEYDLINQLLPILNKAIHSDLDSVNSYDIHWIIEKCSLLLEHLEVLFKKPEMYRVFKDK